MIFQDISHLAATPNQQVPTTHPHRFHDPDHHHCDDITQQQPIFSLMNRAYFNRGKHRRQRLLDLARKNQNNNDQSKQNTTLNDDNDHIKDNSNHSTFCIIEEVDHHTGEVICDRYNHDDQDNDIEMTRLLSPPITTTTTIVSLSADGDFNNDNDNNNKNHMYDNFHFHQQAEEGATTQRSAAHNLQNKGTTAAFCFNNRDSHFLWNTDMMAHTAKIILSKMSSSSASSSSSKIQHSTKELRNRLTKIVRQHQMAQERAKRWSYKRQQQQQSRSHNDSNGESKALVPTNFDSQSSITFCVDRLMRLFGKILL